MISDTEATSNGILACSLVALAFALAFALAIFFWLKKRDFPND